MVYGKSNITASNAAICDIVKPWVKVAPRDESAVEGAMAFLNCRIEGHPAPVVTWTHNGISLIVLMHCRCIVRWIAGKPIEHGATRSRVHLMSAGSRVRIAGVALSDHGRYTCTGTNKAGSVSATAELLVRPRGTA